MRNALSSLKGWQAIPAIIIGLYLLLGVFGPTLAPFPVVGDLKIRNCPPLAIEALNLSNSPSDRASRCNATNILGTDYLGRDIFSRLLHGARTSFLVVVPSVVIGTLVGGVIGALVNGWRRKPRLIAYAVLGLTIVPFAVLTFGDPSLLTFFSLLAKNHVFVMYLNEWILYSTLSIILSEWALVLTLSIFSAVLTLALIAVAYQYDETCRHSWFAKVDSKDASSGFFRLLRRQIATLAPWIGLAAPASAALGFVFLHTCSASVYLPIAWWFELEYPFEHVGILSPFVPMVLFPIGFVTFGVFWFMRHLRRRFTTTSKATLGSTQGTADSPEELSTEEETDRFESPSSEDDGNDAFIESGSRVKRLRWMTVAIVTVAVAAVIRFGVADVVPTVRALAQYSDCGYENACAKYEQERQELLDCACVICSRSMESEPDALKNSEIEVSQRCLDLYFKHRNAPSHRYTVNFALSVLARTLTLALVASIASAVLWSVASASTRAVRRRVEVLVVLAAIIGLMMTFGFTGWYLTIIHWLDSLDPLLYSEYYAVTRAMYMVRDFAVALGISYLTIAMTKPILRFAKTDAVMDVMSRWVVYFMPCVLFISGLLILFDYPFPSRIIYTDLRLSGILDLDFWDDSTHSIPVIADGLWIIETGVWTYWFALMGYAAIVFGFFAAAIWGFRRLVSSNADDLDSTPLNPDNPSPDADSI